MIDPRLVTFKTAAQIKSFTKAGEILNLTQPAVSQQIKSLEEYYGVSLYEKKGRQIQLTSAGEVLIGYITKMEALSTAAVRDLQNQSGLVRRYDLGATLTIGEYVIPPILAEYKKVHPHTDIILQVNNTQSIIENLLSRKLDLALIEGPFEKDRFQYQIFRDDELVLVVSAESTRFPLQGVTLEQALQGKLILRERGSGTRKVFENKLSELGYSIDELPIYMEIGSIHAIKSLVQSDLGYTIISKAAVQKEVAEGSLRIIPLQGIRIHRDFTFIYLPDAPKEFIREFILFCAKE